MLDSVIKQIHAREYDLSLKMIFNTRPADDWIRSLVNPCREQNIGSIPAGERVNCPVIGLLLSQHGHQHSKSFLG